MTNGPHIRYLQLLPVYLQLSLVSPSPVSLAVTGIPSYHRQVYVTDIEVHKARRGQGHPRPRNRDIFTGLDISRIPREDEIPSSPRESASPRRQSSARIGEDCPREPCLVEQPEGFITPGKEDHVCLLRKALYGLKQSPRAWFQLIVEVLVDFDFKQCESDPCIFIHKNVNGERTDIALYVDNLIIAWDNEADIAMIKWCLGERFNMKDLGIARRFLGMEIEYRNDGSIKIHQNRYIQQLLKRHGLRDCNSVTTPLDTSVKLSSITKDEAPADPREYASIVGGLMFAACVTRPDIMCAVGQLSQFLNNPSSKHISAAKRVLRYLQGTSSLGITYRPPPLRLQGYSDADWAGDMDTRKSTTGYVVMLNNGAIAWKSRRQPTVALSTMESEYMALTEATKELKWIRTLLAELSYSNKNSPTDLFSDNQSAIALSKNPVAHARAKHIDLRHHFVREAIQDKIIWVQYIPTTEMTADSLTKTLEREKHEKCTARMGMTT